MKKMLWIACGALAASNLATAQVRTQTSRLQFESALSTSPFRPAKGAGAMTFAPVSQQSSALLVNGSDDCSTADAISGTGSFSFDTTGATTGMNGQLNAPACTSSGLTAIAKDVWFLWTAPTTGLVILSTCGHAGGADTKVAVYDWTAIGSTCPANGAGSTVVGCNDDMSDLNFESRTFWNATAGNQYLVQLGAFPGGTPAGAVGTFTIDYDPVPDPTPCVKDDGSADQLFRFSNAANTEQAVLQAFGNPGELVQVNNILVSYGGLIGFGATNMTDGTPVKAFIYDDPNDDFNPADAVLLQIVNTTIANHDSDIFNAVPLSPAVTVSGVYYVGWAITAPNPAVANFFPFGVDGENCDALPGDAFVCFNAGAAMNFTTLSANSQPPAFITQALFTGGVPTQNFAWMVRPDCLALNSGTPFCFGDGSLTDHTTPCPCGNNGAAGNGCAHSFNPAGANITATGSTQNNDVILHSTGEPATSFTLFLQHSAPGDSVFHDGVLCAGGTLIRLRGRAAVAGEAFFPNNAFAQDSTTTLSQRGGVVPGSGAVRFYTAWFRNASTTFCPPATANVSNGWQITW